LRAAVRPARVEISDRFQFSGQRPPRQLAPQLHPISNSNHLLRPFSPLPAPPPRLLPSKLLRPFRDGCLASRKAEEAGTDLTHLPSLALSAFDRFTHRSVSLLRAKMSRGFSVSTVVFVRGLGGVSLCGPHEYSSTVTGCGIRP
jgi:hypothetical protein